jgi:hypothetical protein
LALKAIGQRVIRLERERADDGCASLSFLVENDQCRRSGFAGGRMRVRKKK